MMMSFQVIGYIEHRSTVDNALLRAPYVGVILYIFYLSFSRRWRPSPSHPVGRLV